MTRKLYFYFQYIKYDYLLHRPTELIEKTMDIFAIKTTKNNIFLGCRNHSVIPIKNGNSLF